MPRHSSTAPERRLKDLELEDLRLGARRFGNVIGFKPGEVEQVGQGFEAMGSREPRQFLRQ
jgi:hypothetical protein